MGKGASARHPSLNQHAAPTSSSSSLQHLYSTLSVSPSSPNKMMDTRPTLMPVKTATFMALWFVFSVASLFVAKHVLHRYALNEAVFTLWQFALSVVFGVIFTKVLCLHTLAPLTCTQLRSIVPLSLTFLVKEVLKYAALSRVSVNLVNTIRSLGPLFNVILEFAFLGHRPSPPILIALIPIVAGVTLTSIDEIHVASTSDRAGSLVIAIIGFLAAILSTAINIGQNIYSKILFGREKIDPVSLQIYLSGISFAIMFPFTFIQLAYESIQGQHLVPAALRSSANAASASGPMILFPTTKSVILSLVAAGFVNFLASQLAFNTLRQVSPLSYSVANTFKRVAIAVIAIFFFHERLSAINGVGIVVSIVGIFIYERQARSQKAAMQYKNTHAEESANHSPTSNNNPYFSQSQYQQQQQQQQQQHYQQQQQQQQQTNIIHFSHTMKRNNHSSELKPLNLETTTSNPISSMKTDTPTSVSGDVQRHLFVDLSSPSKQKPRLKQPDFGETRI